MSLYAIGDLHLSGFKNKPMKVFGDNWANHQEKIEKNWLKAVKEEDTVIIAGDISWALKMEEVICDLDFINKLPGRKIFLRGNHDYWWSSVSKLNSMYKNMLFLQNDCFEYNGIGICGSRGWMLPSEQNFSASDKKTYQRELIRYKLSLDYGVRKGYKDIIFISHFPPAYKHDEKTGFTEILEQYPVSKVIYGHLHGKQNFGFGISGLKNGIDYKLVSADYINFRPVKILD